MLRSALLALAISLPAVSTPAHSAQIDPNPQDPLEQRLVAAESARSLRQAYFDAGGENFEPPLTLEQAFSHLAGAPLSDPSFLMARQRLVDDQRTARARERLDAGGSARARAVAAACDAEDAADALEARLLSALGVGLEIAPGFTAESVELARRAWRAARQTAARTPEDDPNFARAQREAVDAAEAERALMLYQSSALRKMTLPDDNGLQRLVDAELAAAEGQALGVSARSRLERAAPLLGEESRSLIDAALAGGLGSVAVAGAQATQLPPAAAEAERNLRAAELERHTATLEKIRSLQLRYAELEAESVRTRELSILDDTRAEALQQSSLASRDLVRTIRDGVREILALQDTHRTERRERSRDPVVDSGIVAALDKRDADTRDELDAMLDVEKRALALRRDLEPYGESMSRQALFTELVDELEEAPLWLKLEWHKDVRWLRSVPERATDLNAMGEFIEVSFDLLLLALFWIYLRNQAPRWLSRASANIGGKDASRFGLGRWPRRVDERELEAVARYGADALGAFALYRLVLPRSEFLALFALIWMGSALLRCIPAAIRLLLPLGGRALDPLEADTELPAEIKALGESTASWFLWWWILSSVTAFIAVPLLQADTLARLIYFLSFTILVLLIVLALARWSPWTRQFIANLADQSAVSTWLARPVRSRIRQIFLSACGNIYILLRLVFWALVDRGWLSRSGANIAVSQLKLADGDSELLASEERERIRATEPVHIQRAEQLDVLVKAFESWKRERRRGIVAVIGNSGMGKTVFLEQALAALTALQSDVPVSKLELPVQKRSSSLRERLKWLTQSLELEIPKNASRATLEKTIVQHLESLPPRVFLVDDLHFLLRRTVDGFETLEIARNIIQACADEHFWVLTLHRPAWVYIDGASAAMKLAFRERIELPGLDADQLGEHLVEATRSVGLDPEFRSLLLGKRPQADQDTLEHKARRLYWRIVSQQSLGNPRVMSEFWLSGLGVATAATGGMRQVPVYLFTGHGDNEVDGLSDEYLFLLTALIVHDGLSVDDLAEVLNTMSSRVRVACQHLESLGIIGEANRGYVIAPGWQPTVARVLDRRNFVRD